MCRDAATRRSLPSIVSPSSCEPLSPFPPCPPPPRTVVPLGLIAPLPIDRFVLRANDDPPCRSCRSGLAPKDRTSKDECARVLRRFARFSRALRLDSPRSMTNNERFPRLILFIGFALLGEQKRRKFVQEDSSAICAEIKKRNEGESTTCAAPTQVSANYHAALPSIWRRKSLPRFCISLGLA